MEKLGRFLGAFLSVILFMGIYSIAEEITLTTYYPAPYGAYDELTTTGNTYLATTSGNVGIGTTAPGSELHIKGDSSFGSNADLELETPDGGQHWNIVSAQNNGQFRIYDKTKDLDRLVIDTSGNVGIGTTSPGIYKLNVSGDIWCNGDFYDGFMPAVVPDSWPVYMEYATGRFGTPPTSSIRYKKNIVTLDTALEYVKALRPVYFDYKADYLPNTTHQIGLIAEEVASVDPLLAIYRDGRPDDVNYKAVTAFLIKTVQELDRHEGHLNKNGKVGIKRVNPRVVLDGGTLAVNNAQGASGTFTTQDGKTVTVTNGVITNIQ